MEKYFYRPLAAYAGKVFKCAGICNDSNVDMANELFIEKADPVYLPGFVVIDGYRGDKVVIDGGNNVTPFNGNSYAEVISLLNMAKARLEGNEPMNAAWRLADAAGLLREALPKLPGESLIDRDEPTGRGYVLPIKEKGPANPAVLVEVRNVYGNTTIYPANAAAERFAAIAGKKTLNNTDLMNIQALGFVIEEAKPNKLAA